mmetsp:Transcript_26692/g.39655  ORF Transcript_26692/g.39655 Transcript_26692/m.39655 type:complete len:285 (-) Transcript_26692:284-1138(-)
MIYIYIQLLHLFITLQYIHSTIIESDNNGFYYYHVEPDHRKCISPLCGGYWVSRVNKQSTICHDHTKSSRCYVADIDGFNGESGVVKATMTVKSYEEHGKLGYMHALESWSRAEGSVLMDSSNFYMIQDSGIRCVTYPCFNIDEIWLNHGTVEKLSGVGGVHGERVLSLISETPNSNVLIAGRNKVESIDGTNALSVDVDALYLPSVECQNDDECTVTPYHTFVSSSEDCYCVMCPTFVTSLSIAQANADSWDTHCDHNTMQCRAVRCRSPPSPLCSKASKCVE